MKLTKQRILDLYQALNNLGELRGVKFSYGVSKNISILEREVKSLSEAIKPSPELAKFDEERVELAKSCAEKDEKGEPITFIDNGQERFKLKDEKEFDKKFDKLKEKHKEVVAEREKQIQEYNKLLETETEIELHKIKLKDVPEEISVAQMQSILPLTEE